MSNILFEQPSRTDTSPENLLECYNIQVFAKNDLRNFVQVFIRVVSKSVQIEGPNSIFHN